MRTIGFLIAGLALVAAPQPLQADGGAPSLMKVKIPPALIAKANDPKPPANATQKTSVGRGKTAANTANGSGDTDSFWVEQIDVDGDGDVDLLASCGMTRTRFCTCTTKTTASCAPMDLRPPPTC